jgi:hypothetical protein
MERGGVSVLMIVDVATAAGLAEFDPPKGFGGGVAGHRPSR